MMNSPQQQQGEQRLEAAALTERNDSLHLAQPPQLTHNEQQRLQLGRLLVFGAPLR